MNSSARQTETDGTAHTPAGGVGRLLAWLLVAGGALGLATFALGAFGRVTWHLNLLAQLRPQVVIGLFAVGAALVAWRGFRAYGVTFVVCAVLIGLTLRPWFGRPEGSPGPNRLRVLTFNLAGWNRNHAAVLDFLRACDADIVILLEVQPHWEDALAGLPGYPWRRYAARTDNFGIAALLRRPPLALTVLPGGVDDLPCIDLTVAADGTDRAPLRIIGVHPPPPMSADLHRRQRTLLTDLAAAVATTPNTPVLVTGDLNLTPWTGDFAETLAQTGLRDGSRGFGYHETWNHWRIPGLGLPIDHSLVGGPVAVLTRELGPWCGSDHRPVLVTVGW
jgi:endonuclease/exonuclease/phosphatase (EEP) superfamily protein YafD